MASSAFRRILFTVVLALPFAGGACRKNERALFPVSGRVTYQGAPAAGAVVFFHRQGGDPLDQTTMGIVRDNGTFEVVCGPWGKGAPAGTYDVTAEWKTVVGQQGGNPQRGPDKFNGRFADRLHPLLHATVEPRPNELSTFELSD